MSLLADYDSMQPNTTEEPFDWEKVSLAWADIFGRTADVQDVHHFHAIQQGGIGASCAVISLRYIAPWKPLHPTRKLSKNPTLDARNRNARRGGGAGEYFEYGDFGFDADAGFGDAAGSNSNGGSFGDGGGGSSSSGAGDSGGGSGGKSFLEYPSFKSEPMLIIFHH